MMKILFNPFEKYDENKLLAAGSVGLILAVILSLAFNARFDGVLDLHFIGNTSTREAFLDNLIDVIVLTSALYIAGKFINPKTRRIDMLNVVLIARIPIYLLAFLNYNNKMYDVSQELISTAGDVNSLFKNYDNLAFLIVAGLLSLFFLIWSIIILYNGYKISSNAKGGRHVALFIIVLLFSEVISKLLITLY